MAIPQSNDGDSHGHYRALGMTQKAAPFYLHRKNRAPDRERGYSIC